METSLKPVRLNSLNDLDRSMLGRASIIVCSATNEERTVRLGNLIAAQGGATYALFPETRKHARDIRAWTEEIFPVTNHPFVIATMSEHIVSTLAERIGRGQLNAEDVAVIVLHDDGTLQICPFNANGAIYSSWPFGFYEG